MPGLSSNSLKEFLKLSRETLKTFLKTGDHLSYEPRSEEVKLPKACFVTLRKNSELRGCVGTFDATEPLYQNIIRMSIAAASQDTRFPSVTKDELQDITIDLSILSEREKVQSFDEIQIGKHGVYIKYGDRGGTFLPEVALEQKWNALEFVTYCAREKAGLDPSECQLAEVYRYEVQKISES